MSYVEDEIRDMPRVLRVSNKRCVTCLTVADERVFWCTVEFNNSDPTLHLWDCASQEPVESLAALSFVPLSISSFEEKIILVGDVAVALFTLEQPSSIEPYVIAEEFLFYDLVRDVTHIAWTPDGTMTALSSPFAVSLVDCRVGFDDDERRPPVDLDCSAWYGDSGAAFAVFSASCLFLLSSRNHLVRVRYVEECPAAAVMDRDGHVLTPTHRATALCVSGGSEGNLLVGFSNGTLRLVQQDTLEVFFTVDVTGHPSAGPQPVLALASGRRHTFVIVPGMVVCYDSASWEPLPEYSTEMDTLGEVTNGMMRTDVVVCNGYGSWAAWLSAQQTFVYHAVTPIMRHARTAGGGMSGMGGLIGRDDVVHANTPLRAALLQPLRLPAPLSDRRGGRPVTFGRPIRSSGYTADVPWSVRQKQKQKQRDGARPISRPPPAAAAALCYRPQPLSTSPLRPMATANHVLAAAPIHCACVSAAAFAAGGTALLTASGDGAAHWLKYPVARHKGEGVMLRAHTAPLHAADVSLSASAPLVATASADGNVMLWKPTQRESPLVRRVVGKEVRAVKFFYTDKFVCYAAGNTVSLCRFVLDDGGGDLDRKRNNSAMDCVLEFTPESMQHVSALEGINYFTSNILLWAGSNKSVGVYDVAAERTIQVVAEAHTRPIHHIAMMTASRYASPGVSQLHLYVTAGLDNTARLWDLRQERPVRQFATHRNSATAVGVAFAPSGTCVAVGSETRAVCVYDIGTGTVLDNLDTRDIPTAISWHPVNNALVVGTAAGSLQLFGQV